MTLERYESEVGVLAGLLSAKGLIEARSDYNPTTSVSFRLPGPASRMIELSGT